MAAPPVEEKTSYSGFQAKKATARPKLDKAEITQMNAIQTEENRIVFEGMVFDLEKRLLAQGAYLLILR